MSPGDKQIADILAKYGEEFSTSVWRVQGTAVIYHKALERIAAQAKITFDPPTILRAERDEAVMLVSGKMGERAEWSIGEALINVNYRVSGKQAAYVYAMSEKRAKDRVILKLIELHGLVYSEEEADEFKSGRPPADPQLEELSGNVVPIAKPSPVETDLKAKIDRAQSINAITDLMLHPDTQKSLNELPPGLRDEVRDYAKSRLVALGWPSKVKAPEPKRRRQRLPDKTPTEQAGILCADARFQRFLCERGHAGEMTEEEAVGAVYGICGIRSRRELAPGSPAAMAWTKLVQDFEAWKVEPVA